MGSDVYAHVIPYVINDDIATPHVIYIAMTLLGYKVDWKANQKVKTTTEDCKNTNL